jgi:hypothetical protein
MEARGDGGGRRGLGGDDAVDRGPGYDVDSCELRELTS